jgi:hypothetical protein
MDRHIVLILDDSKRKLSEDEEAALQAGIKREDVYPFEDPTEAEEAIKDLHDQILAVVTDDFIDGFGKVGVRMVGLANRWNIPVLIYTTQEASSFPAGHPVQQRTGNHEDNINGLRGFLEKAKAHAA